MEQKQLQERQLEAEVRQLSQELANVTEQRRKLQISAPKRSRNWLPCAINWLDAKPASERYTNWRLRERDCPLVCARFFGPKRTNNCKVSEELSVPC